MSAAKFRYEAAYGGVYIRERGEDPSKIADCENGDQGIAEAIAGALNLTSTLTDAQVATAQERITALEAKCDLLAASWHKAEAERDMLLEACKAIQPYFEGEHAHDHPDCVRLRAAIAKAEGGAK